MASRSGVGEPGRTGMVKDKAPKRERRSRAFRFRNHCRQRPHRYDEGAFAGQFWAGAVGLPLSV